LKKAGFGSKCLEFKLFSGFMGYLQAIVVAKGSGQGWELYGLSR
jgi:hypothetical protein